jgi:hypothetical protein
VEARAILEAATEDQADLKLRAVHALSQSCGQYAKGSSPSLRPVSEFDG